MSCAISRLQPELHFVLVHKCSQVQNGFDQEENWYWLFVFWIDCGIACLDWSHVMVFLVVPDRIVVLCGLVRSAAEACGVRHFLRPCMA